MGEFERWEGRYRVPEYIFGKEPNYFLAASRHLQPLGEVGRRNAIFTSIISQVTPSESSLIKRVSLEPLLLQSLRDGMALSCVKRVSLHEPLTNLRKLVILHIAKGAPRTEMWRAMYGLVSQHRAIGKCHRS